jgi:DnaK suppressor protein
MLARRARSAETAVDAVVTAKGADARRTTGKSSAAKKSDRKKSATTTPRRRRPPARRPRPEAATKKSASKKTASKKTASKKATDPRRRRPRRRRPRRRRPRRRPKKTAKKAATTKKRPASSRPATVSLAVLPGEDPWTTAEVDEVRGELEAERQRLLSEISSAEDDMATLLRDAGVGAGSDQADIGSSALERDSEMSLANNTRDMLFQVDRAKTRLDDGSYGVCESCGNPIGKARLMAFPRATLCLPCKQRQERR